MKPNVWLYAVVGATLFSGCTSVTTSTQSPQLQSMLTQKVESQKVTAGTPATTTTLVPKLDQRSLSQRKQASTLAQNPGLQNLARQVLHITNSPGVGSPTTTTLTSSVSTKSSTLRGVKYAYNDMTMPKVLAEHSFVKKVVLNQIQDSGKVTVSVSEMKSFAKQFYTVMADPYPGTEQMTFLAEANKKSELAFGNMLLGYFMAYQKGNFVLHDGTVLGKPKASVKVENGKIVGSLDNDTIAGLITVFAEAMYDYGFGTPIYFQMSTEDKYKEEYKADDAHPNEYRKCYTKLPPERDYLVGGKTPTAAAFLQSRQIVDCDTNKVDDLDLTLKEFQFIRFASSMATDRSKELSGLITRSLGSIDGGFIILGSFSIGNNETLAKIIETSISSLSGRLTEYGLTEGLGRYRGGNDSLDLLLDHYKAIGDQIAKLENPDKSGEQKMAKK